MSSSNTNNNNNNNNNSNVFSSSLQKKVKRKSPSSSATLLQQHQQEQQKVKLQAEQDEDEVCLEDDDDNIGSEDEEEYEEETDEEEEEEDSSFEIPKNPSGRILIFRILSSWGSPSTTTNLDTEQQQPHQQKENCDDTSHLTAGLAGVELFDKSGVKIDLVNNASIMPLSCASSSSSSSSSSSLTNILREPFDTSDRSKMWVANGGDTSSSDSNNIGFALILSPSSSSPSSSSSSLIKSSSVSLSAIRIWNYNSADRSHLNWGVKRIQLFLDETVIFSGDIRRAQEGDPRNESGVETILFTDEPKVLTKIAQQAEERSLKWQNAPTFSSSPPEQAMSSSFKDKENNNNQKSFVVAKSIENFSPSLNHLAKGRSSLMNDDGSSFMVLNNLELILADNWNEEGSCIALTGIQFLDENEEVVLDTENMVERITLTKGWGDQATPEMLSSSPSESPLLDNNTETSWIFAATTSSPSDHLPLLLKFIMKKPCRISAIRIANFSGKNTSSSTTSTTDFGLKHFRIRIDGKEILDGADSRTCKHSHQWLVARKAPAGSHRMDKLLFQSFKASSLIMSSNNSSSPLLSASVTTLAKTAILRSRYLSMLTTNGNTNNTNNNPSSSSIWPDWIPSSLDQNVPFLPSGYIFSLGLKIICDVNAPSSILLSNNNKENNQQQDNNKVLFDVSNLVLLDEEGDELEQDFVCCNPSNSFVCSESTKTNTTANIFSTPNKTMIHIAFETLRTLSLLSCDLNFDQRNSSDLFTTSFYSLEVQIFCNDEIIYGSTSPIAKKKMQCSSLVVPFTPDQSILNRFKTKILE